MLRHYIIKENINILIIFIYYVTQNICICQNTHINNLGDAELAALRARLAETERAMQRIVGQLARRDAVYDQFI